MRNLKSMMAFGLLAAAAAVPGIHQAYAAEGKAETLQRETRVLETFLSNATGGGFNVSDFNEHVLATPGAGMVPDSMIVDRSLRSETGSPIRVGEFDVGEGHPAGTAVTFEGLDNEGCLALARDYESPALKMVLLNSVVTWKPETGNRPAWALGACGRQEANSVSLVFAREE